MVGVPRTSPEASPLSTSRRMRRLTSGPTRSSSKRATSRPSCSAYPRRSSSSSPFCRLKEKLVHGPETALHGGCLGGGGRPERMRMDLDEGKVPGKQNEPARSVPARRIRSHETLAGSKGTVVAVLEDQSSGRRPAGVVDLIVQWGQTRPDVFRQLRLQVSRPLRLLNGRNDRSAHRACGSCGCPQRGTGELRRQELSGSVQRRGPFVEDRVIGLEDVGHAEGDVGVTSTSAVAACRASRTASSRRTS